MRDLTIWLRAVITITMSVTIIAVTCCAAERPGGPASTWRPRYVGSEEIEKSRGEIEDRLRKEVLGAIYPVKARYGGPVEGRGGLEDEGPLIRLRKILNGPWDRAAVENLGSFVLDNPPRQGQGTFWKHELNPIANLIAYVGKEYAEKPAGAAAKEVLDKFIERALLTDRKTTAFSNFWLGTTDAIAQYGTADLLPESFWKGIEQGEWAPRVLEAVGDEKVLKRLKSIRDQKKKEWPISPVISKSIDDTVFFIEAQLEYPELKQLSNRSNWRFEMAKMLQRVKKENRAEAIEKLAGAEKNTDWRRVLAAIAARLKKEEAASHQNK